MDKNGLRPRDLADRRVIQVGDEDRPCNRQGAGLMPPAGPKVNKPQD
jgi:hypothetical protein